MPRGMSPYQTARLQGRLWLPEKHFDPNSILAWYNDRSPITIATGVSQWNDLSPNARHVAQATTGKQPTNVTNARNGLRALQFSGGQHLELTTSAVPTGPMSAFVVARKTANVDNCFWEWGATTSVNSGTGLFQEGSLYKWRVNGSGTSQVTWDDTNWNVFSGYNKLGDIQQGYLNGVASPSNSGSNGFTLVNLRIGRLLQDFYPLTGFIGEIIMLQVALSQRELRLMEGHLAWKWATLETLSAAHPYKNRPPLIGD